MSDKEAATGLNEASPSVQAHLGILQAVIQRMASNSASCKTWCITIVSAILVIVAEKGNPNLAWIAVFPTVLFAALDIYYLALEKSFRNSYNVFLRKLHRERIEPEDLFSVEPLGDQSSLRIAAAKSYSIWGFYVPLILFAVLTHLFVAA